MKIEGEAISISPQYRENPSILRESYYLVSARLRRELRFSFLCTFRLSRLNISLKEREKNGWRESADRLGSLLINYKYHCVTIIIDLF